MNLPVLLRRTEHGLEPADQHAEEALAKVKPGERIAAQLRQPRKLPQHQAFWCMLKRVAEASEYETPERLLTAIKVAAGYFDLVRLPSGKTVVAPHSISFVAMDQVTFARFVEIAERLILRDVLGGEDPMGLLA